MAQEGIVTNNGAEATHRSVQSIALEATKHTVGATQGGVDVLGSQIWVARELEMATGSTEGQDQKRIDREDSPVVIHWEEDDKKYDWEEVAPLPRNGKGKHVTGDRDFENARRDTLGRDGERTCYEMLPAELGAHETLPDKLEAHKMLPDEHEAHKMCPDEHHARELLPVEREAYEMLSDN